MNSYGTFLGLLLVWGAWSTRLSADILESFEGKQFWQVAPWGDEAKSALSQERSSDGQSSLEVYFGPEMKNQNKGIVIERDLSNYGQEFNKLAIDVFNEGPAKLSVALAVETDEYFESQSLPLEKGWNNNIAFFLATRTFKSKSSNWRYETSVNLKSQMKKVYLIFYRNQAPEGSFFLDKITVSQELAPAGTQSGNGSMGKHDVERSKKYHYRPKGLPLEIFTR